MGARGRTAGGRVTSGALQALQNVEVAGFAAPHCAQDTMFMAKTPSLADVTRKARPDHRLNLSTADRHGPCSLSSSSGTLVRMF